MKKLSIIVPCYNAELYIDKCMNTIVNQTLVIDNMEIIAINDGSMDNTFQVLSKWEEKYSESIIIINLDNNYGPGKVRNLGIDYASSDYIAFVDIDDLIELSMFEKMCAKAYEENCDLVVCRSDRIKDSNLNELQVVNYNRQDSSIKIYNDMDRKTFLCCDINSAVWNKIYKKDIIKKNSINFMEGYIYEDIYFSELVKLYVSHVYFIDEILYHHVIRANSLSNNVANIDQKLDWIYVEEIKLRELNERNLYERFKDHYDNEFFLNYLALIKNLIKVYGYIEPDRLSFINSRINIMYPDYFTVPIVRKLLNTKGFYYQVLNALNERITESNVHKIVESYYIK